ncbi:uncharacterized protein A4U43_C04F3630 [Asparagus officinalis]|uniref:Uncharacterized protein n=1 Tax=Asparagus officinalis TaxID=4686 RepID=A0A5P1EYP5_ASPOF|nr:uncharacterized protein LOC109839723 [Asparagus officinalis]ONK70994.1 uncharacterized protein A4U43_C04F3630 [Asparagus officinalis]
MLLTLLVYTLCLIFLHFFTPLHFLPCFLPTMNIYRDEHNPCCYFHPKEAVTGVCAPCLRERLLSLASKHGNLPVSRDSRSFRVLRRRPAITLPKVFALGSLLLRLESRRKKPDDDESDPGSIDSLEDSFISIKFEDNGQASWESKQQEITRQSSTEAKAQKRVIEHVKPRGPLRWRKRIGQLLQLARWKRSSKAGASHVGLAGKVEGRRGWIRSLTRKRTTE